MYVESFPENADFDYVLDGSGSINGNLNTNAVANMTGGTASDLFHEAAS